MTDNHEPRLQALEKFLHQFSHILDQRKDPEPPLFSSSEGQQQQQQQQQSEFIMMNSSKQWCVTEYFI